MSQDNDPWGNRPKNTEGNELSGILNKLKESFLGGGNNNQPDGNKPNGKSELHIPKKAIAPILGIAVLLWGASGIYILQEGFHGVELTFGKHTETAVQPGINFHKPYPIGKVNKVDVGSLKTIDTGGASGNSRRQILTSDENIVEVSLAVQYRVGNAEDFLFNLNGPERVLGEALASSVREVVGANNVDYVLTEGRSEWPALVKQNLVDTLERYQSGILVERVELRDAKAPDEVQAAFDDAVKAREDAERYVLQAQAYRNQQIPLARAQAKEITERAETHKAEVIARATGETTRFNDILTNYRMAPEITRDRMYIETLQSVYSRVNNVIVDTGENAPILYLPVGENQGKTEAPVPVNAPRHTLNQLIQDDKDAAQEKNPTNQSTQQRLTR